MTKHIITVRISQQGFMADLLKFYRELPKILDFSDRDYRCDFTFYDNGNVNVAFYNVQTDLIVGDFIIELDLQERSFAIRRLVSPTGEVEQPLFDDVAVRLCNALDPLNITYGLRLDKCIIYRSVESPKRLFIWEDLEDEKRGVVFAMAHDVEEAMRCVLRFAHDSCLGNYALDEVAEIVNREPQISTSKPTGCFLFERSSSLGFDREAERYHVHDWQDVCGGHKFVKHQWCKCGANMIDGVLQPV